MQEYDGLTEADLKIIQIALSKLQITGAEASMMVNLQQKIQMEIELLKTPKAKKVKRVILSFFLDTYIQGIN